MDDPCATLMREIASAQEQDRPLLHIRVTPDALRGTPASLPVTPERLRVLYPESVKLGLIENGLVPHHGMELVVHPEDWRDVLKVVMPYASPTANRGDEFMGYPVIS